MVSTDGTYKIEYMGCVLIVAGTITFTYAGSTVVHSFRPWAYSLARTESTEVCRIEHELYQTLNQNRLLHFRRLS